MKKILGIILLAVVLIMTAYFSFVYFVPYSEGIRSGELIKISHKGVLIKTWEGEISQGISGAQIFSFSVIKDDVIAKLKEHQGDYVKVTYIERYRTFFWLGDSNILSLQLKKRNLPT